MIGWKRFWCPLGTAISCGPDGKGFLDNPEGLFGAYTNAALRDITQLLDHPCLVLCGEPGIGKSSTIAAARGEILHRVNSEENLIWIEFRSIPDTATFLKRTLDSSKWKAWQRSTDQLVLVIDGIDEGLIKIPDFVPFFTEELKNVDRMRLHVILVCRTAEWPIHSGNQLISLWGPAADSYAYELCPLREVDARMAAESSNVDADTFLEAVYKTDVVGLAARPITLFFLLDEFRRNGALPGSHRELYERGCAHFCSEPDAARAELLRRRFGDHPTPSAAQVLQIACRLAGLLMLSGRLSIFVGSKEHSTATDIHISDVTFGHETAGGETFKVTEFFIIHTLATALFSSRGEDRFGFAHQTFAECLGAKYMENLPLVQVTELLCQREGAEIYVVPQLGEMAAWLAGGHHEFLQLVLRSEPELLLRSDVARLDNGIKAALVQSVIKRVEKEEALEFRNYTQFYGSLDHPDLEKQLARVIRDKQSNIILLRLVLDIASACRVSGLATDLLKRLRDPATDARVKGHIAKSLAELIPVDRRHELIPLAENKDGEDNEVKGAALRALIPDVWKVRDALPYLTYPDDTIGGSYWHALHFDIPKNIEVEDLPDALKSIASWDGCFGLGHPFKKIADRAFLEASKHLDDPTVNELFVTVWLASSRPYAPLPIGEDFEFNEEVMKHPEKRRAVLTTILNSCLCLPEDIPSLHLVSYDDLPWLLNEIMTAPPLARANWAAAIDQLVSPQTAFKSWDELLSAIESIPELRDRLSSLRAWQLDEDHATSEDRFVKSSRSFDVRNSEKLGDGKPILRRHLIVFLLDLYLAHGRLPFLRSPECWRSPEPDYFAFLLSVSIRSLAAGPDDAGFWPVISWPSATV